MAKKTKTLLALFALLILFGCAEKEKKESTDWSLSIQANTATREQHQAALNGRIRYILNGVEGTKELPEYDLPTSALMQFQADRVLEIELDAVEYDSPVFLHLIRYENLAEIKWPEEAVDLETSRFLYARTDNLNESFYARPEASPIEIKRKLDQDALNYGTKEDLTKEQVLNVFRDIDPEIYFEESEGWVQTAKEKYNVDLLTYRSDDQEVQLEVTVTSRKNKERVESMELQIIFPIGKYDQLSDSIDRKSSKYIEGFLRSVLVEENEINWITEDIFIPLHSNQDGRILEVGDYLLTTYRLSWDFIDPVEHMGLFITTKN